MRAHPTSLRATCAVVLGAGLVVGLTGCGQPSPRASTPPAPTTVDVVIQPTIAPYDPTAADTAPDPSAPADESLEDASAALTDESCEPQGDVWSFSGTLTNKNATAETYTIGITILKTSDTSDVFTRELTVTVQPGQSVPVSAKDFHRAPAKGLTCLTGVTVKGQ